MVAGRETGNKMTLELLFTQGSSIYFAPWECLSGGGIIAIAVGGGEHTVAHRPQAAQLVIAHGQGSQGGNAQDALAGGGVGISIDESGHLGIVITGLEVVERSLGVLELVARPIFSFLSPKKSRRFFGGCCCLSSLYDIQFTVIDYRRPSVFLF